MLSGFSLYSVVKATAETQLQKGLGKYGVQTDCVEIGVCRVDSKRFDLSVVEVDGDETDAARVAL